VWVFPQEQILRQPYLRDRSVCAERRRSDSIWKLVLGLRNSESHDLKHDPTCKKNRRRWPVEVPTKVGREESM
jgi:hypothetical protein